MQFIIELRPRLGSANAFYKTPNEIESVLISSEGQILVKESGISKASRFSWPVEYGQINSQSLHNVTKTSEGISFRLRFQNVQFSLLNSGQVLKVRRKFKLPCQIPSSVEEGQSKLTIFCANCKNEFKEIQVKRILPLPSIDWKDEIQDWFCGCSHGPTTTAGKRKEAAAESECSSGESNRNLHTKGVAPRQSDLLYSSGFVRFYYMATAVPEDQAKVKKAEVSCDKCLAPLGTYSAGEKMMHVWHHTVIIMSRKIDKLPYSSCPSETFLMVIGGICSEHDWIPLKIRLINGEGSSRRRSLFIWMLEPDLKLLSTDEKSYLGAKSVLKVMFRHEEIDDGDADEENFQLQQKLLLSPTAVPVSESKLSLSQVDQELEIPLSVLKAGLETLKMSMEWIPPHQRHDSDFSIGYIDLSPVLIQ